MPETIYPPFSVLLVDDEPAWLRSLGISLERSAGITNILQCQHSRQVMDLLCAQDVGLVLLDLTMPHLSGEALLAMIAEHHPEIAVIIISGMNQLETAVKCIKLGAYDYFVKTAEEDRLISGILRAIRMLELQRENRDMKSRFLSNTLECPEAFSEIIAGGKSMRSICLYLESVARSRQPVLITGESGVGKELIARALHTLSRSAGQLVAVNVAGLDDTVFADTLFGHVRGAYTGAAEARRGMVEQAADGTLFLDEIGDLSLVSQVKLLRLLQEGEYFPLGSDRPKRAKLRVIAATNQDLTARQQSGAFRKDLYYRLCTHHVHVPPLRERKEDITVLLEHFLEDAARSLGKKKPTIPKELPVLLGTYRFPGNIRELRSMVYDALSRHQAGILSMEAFRSAIQPRGTVAENVTDDSAEGANPFTCVAYLPTLDEAMELLVAEAMRRSQGNQTIASRMLGISQPALSKRLKLSRL
ncbi:MAG: sigma-54-dependent transcriptional regulator [Syntrophobacteraceae bacterium]